ncbi:hypothetical protein [Paracoccus ravus]|uniref:hypothetical protein n=1 Tax=Paracoccus ravus TaxID=2447760 RepID=UPI00106EBADB|nr:hypothetical protein [Paracoccus ravus]
MPNGLAYLMLFAWPLVAQAFFRAMPVYKALIWSVMVGYLILPAATSIKVPMIPALDKHSVVVLSALILCRLNAGRDGEVDNTAIGAERTLVRSLLVLVIGAPFLTAVTNPEPLVYGPRYIPGLTLYDSFSMISGAAVALLPYMLARRYLTSQVAHLEILRAFVLCGLAYSLPALVEVRLSPQLHVWIYGFFPHDFIQHIRAGGYRPILFLSHGLMVGIFFCMSIISALVLWREARREGQPARKWLLAALWLTFVLVLVKSVGALAIAVAVGAIVALLGQRMQVLFAAVVAVVVLFYPTLRGAGYIPVDRVFSLALSYSEDRALSLKFRLDNEDALLARANEKPLFGWGGWGRPHIFDPETGRMTSVTDGIWVILIGIYGWTGYLAYFGLLTAPILIFAWRRTRYGPSFLAPGLMLLLSATLIDFLPNASLVPYVWMIAGAASGFVPTSVAAARSSNVRPTGEARLRPLLE